LLLDLTLFRFYLVTPSPFIPLPLGKGKGEVVREGLRPSKTPYERILRLCLSLTLLLYISPLKERELLCKRDFVPLKHPMSVFGGIASLRLCLVLREGFTPFRHTIN